MKDLIVKEVEFNGSNLLATEYNDKIYVAIRWVSEGIGFNDRKCRAEVERVASDLVLKRGVQIIGLPTNSGIQDVTCIELDYLPLWLAKINVNIIEDDIIADKLIEYQLKAKDVLANAFLNKKEEFIIPKTFGEALKLAYEQQLIIEEQQLTIIEKDKEIESQGNVIIGLVREISLEEKRQILNEVIRKGGKNYSERWNLLYKHFSEKYHINLKIRRENWDAINKPKSKNMLDFIERGLGMLPELYDISCKLFHGDIDDIIEHYIQVRGI